MQTSHQESGGITLCQFVPTDGWPEVGLSLFNQDCSWMVLSLHKWFCENAVLSLSDSDTHLAVQVTRSTVLMPLILRHPLGCFCVCIHLKILAIATKLFPGAPHCGSSTHCGTATCHCHPMNRGWPCSHRENLPTPAHSEVVPWKGH